MIDSLPTYYNASGSQSKSRAKQSMASSRTHCPTASSLSEKIQEKLTKRKTPAIKLISPFEVDFNYISIDTDVDFSTGKNLHKLVESFFSHDVQRKALPFNEEDWRVILVERKSIEHDLCRKRLHCSLYYGLPAKLRRDIWLYLGEVENLKREFGSEDLQKSESDGKSLNIIESYSQLKSKASSQEDKIANDVKRSFYDHKFFATNKEEKTQSLHRILRAYANFDKEVGYTQGMNFIVGMLLFFLGDEFEEKPVTIEEEKKEDSEDPVQKIPLEKIEEDAFWLFVYIMQKRNWRNLFINQTPKLQELLDGLNQRVKDELPKLHRLFTETNCLIGCFTQHFLTALTYNCELELAKRTLEVFLVVGENIITHVLMRTLAMREQEILALEDTEGLFNYLRNELLCISKKKEIEGVSTDEDSENKIEG